MGNRGGAFLPDGVQLRLELHTSEWREGEFSQVGEYVSDQGTDRRQVVRGGVIDLRVFPGHVAKNRPLERAVRHIGNPAPRRVCVPQPLAL